MLKSEFFPELKDVYDLACSCASEMNKITKGCLYWMDQVKRDANSNNSLPMLPKTPLACKRARKKRRMSPIDENGIHIDSPEFVPPRPVAKTRKTIKKVVSTGIRQSRRNTGQRRSNSSQYGLRGQKVSASAVTVMDWQTISSELMQMPPEYATAKRCNVSDMDWQFQEADVCVEESKSPATQITMARLQNASVRMSVARKSPASNDISSQSQVTTGKATPLIHSASYKLRDVTVDLGPRKNAVLSTGSYLPHKENVTSVTKIEEQTQDATAKGKANLLEETLSFIDKNFTIQESTDKNKMSTVTNSHINEGVSSSFIVSSPSISSQSAPVNKSIDSGHEIHLDAGNEDVNVDVLDTSTSEDELPLSTVKEVQTDCIVAPMKNCHNNASIPCNKLSNSAKDVSETSKHTVNGEKTFIPKTGLVHVDHAPKSKLCKSPIIFSPYANQPVKTRVAAYEKLKPVNEVEVEVPKTPGPVVRMTRTKTKAIAEAAAAHREVNENKQPRNECNETLKKMAVGFLLPQMGSQKNRKAHKPSNENSLLSLSSKSSQLSASKTNSRHLQSSFKVLAELSTNSSAQVNRNLSVKYGNILTNVESYIKKANTKTNLDVIDERKQEERRKRQEREQDAMKKKDLLIKQKAEAQRRKREEKMQRVHQAHLASLKEKEDCQRRLEKEKEEKLLQIKEKEMKQKEELLKKKQRAQQKVVEFEERRRQEEAARLAKLKEQEEEQRRIKAARKKEQEEAERQNIKRREAEKELALQREKAEQLAVAQDKINKTNSGKVEDNKEESQGPLNYTFDIPSTTYNHYRISDVESGDSSDDEDQPKKCIPTWASKARRKDRASMLSYLPHQYKTSFMSSARHTPDLKAFFPNIDKHLLTRTSSAIWRTPPVYKKP